VCSQLALQFTQTVILVGFECASVVPLVLGVRGGHQRCRVLIHDRRLYKTLVFSSDIQVWEVCHFIEASLLGSRRHSRHARSGSLYNDQRQEDSAYALYVATLKKAMDVVVGERRGGGGHDEGRARGRKRTGAGEEAKPWRRLISYRLKDKVCPSLHPHALNLFSYGRDWRGAMAACARVQATAGDAGG
jgi:hypothetical protein